MTEDKKESEESNGAKTPESSKNPEKMDTVELLKKADPTSLNLGGIVPLSTVDWPGTASMVIFMRGCPLRCPHCFNDHLQTGESFEDLAFVEKEIENAALFISSIVFSGGEALMQSDAVRYIAGFAKKLGLKVGVESCGFYPERLASLLEECLLDQVFLDVKATLKDPEYASATSRFGVAPKVIESLEICLEAGAPFEVRVTVFPETAKCVENIGTTLSHMGIGLVTFQQGMPKESEEPFEPVPKDQLEAFAESFRALGISAKVRIKGELD